MKNFYEMLIILSEEKETIFRDYSPKKIIFTGFIKDGRVFSIIDGIRRTFVTDAIYHDRWKKASIEDPKSVYDQIIKLINNGEAFEA